MASEKARGSRRKKVDIEARKKRAQEKADVLRAIHLGDEKLLRRALIAAGWDERSPAFERALKEFRAGVRKLRTK
jgi:hypothetical protein